MRRHYREKIYECGDYMEVHMYPVYRKAGVRRKKAKPTKDCQKKLNQIHAENNCIRLAHANFTSQDMRLDLTYAPKHHPVSDEEAARELTNFLRRVKRYRKKKGLPDLKYIAVTEKGKKNSRYHHHLIINGGLSPQEIVELWGRGYARTDALQFDEDGIAALVRYILKKPIVSNEKSVVSKKRWNASKNLIRPKVKERDDRLSARKIKELARDTQNNREYEKYYDGYFFSGANVVFNDTNGGVYLYARFYKKEAAFCKTTNRPRKRSK